MEKLNAEQYIEQRVDDQMNWYDRKSQSNQNYYKRLRTLEIICAILIPFLSGYAHFFKGGITVLTGIVGLIVAGVAGLLSLYQFQENWIKYRTTCESLKKEKFLFLTCTEPYHCPDDDKRLSILVNRVETLISQENTNWSQYMMRPQDDSGDDS